MNQSRSENTRVTDLGLKGLAGVQGVHSLDDESGQRSERGLVGRPEHQVCVRVQKGGRQRQGVSQTQGGGSPGLFLDRGGGFRGRPGFWLRNQEECNRLGRVRKDRSRPLQREDTMKKGDCDVNLGRRVWRTFAALFSGLLSQPLRQLQRTTRLNEEIDGLVENDAASGFAQTSGV